MSDVSRNFFKRVFILSGVIPVYFTVFLVQLVLFPFGYALIPVLMAWILHPYQACAAVCLEETLNIISLVGCFVYAVYVFNHFSWRPFTYTNVAKNSVELLCVSLLYFVPATYVHYTLLTEEYSNALTSSQLITFEQERSEALEWNQRQIEIQERLLETEKAYSAGTISQEEWQKAYNEIQGGGKFKIIVNEDLPVSERIKKIEAGLEEMKAYSPESAQERYANALTYYNELRQSYESRGVPTIIDAIERTLGFRGW